MIANCNSSAIDGQPVETIQTTSQSWKSIPIIQSVCRTDLGMRIWRDAAQNPEMPVKVQQGFIDCPDAPNDFALEMLCATPQHLESLVPSPACTISAQRQTDSVEPRMRYEEPSQEREEDWRRSLHSLQECICELLIRNQELRMLLLDSATSHQSWEADQ